MRRLHVVSGSGANVEVDDGLFAEARANDRVHVTRDDDLTIVCPGRLHLDALIVRRETRLARER